MNRDAQRGERIREERDRLGLSQQSMADAVGVRREMWAKYESGAEPGANALAAIAATDADVLYILTGVRSGASALSREEAALLDNYRHCSPQVREHLAEETVLFAQREMKGKIA
ncbi:transcriptional regulator [Betaproteobacteria bacterium]|nr:transcriptional regulator [Betaproteobacteria bacterium]